MLIHLRRGKGNDSKWHESSKEHAFESPEATECFVTRWTVKISCNVENVQDRALLHKCMFSLCFYSKSNVSAEEETVSTMRQVIKLRPDKISDVI